MSTKKGPNTSLHKETKVIKYKNKTTHKQRSSLQKIRRYHKQEKVNRILTTTRKQKEQYQETKRVGKIIKKTENGIEKGQNTKNLKGQHKINTLNPILVSKNAYPSIFSWIASHKFYPIEAIYKNEQGRVKLEFILTKDGNIKNIKIIKPSFATLNSAAIKILNRSNPVPKVILKTSKLKLPAKLTIVLEFMLNSED